MSDVQQKLLGKRIRKLRLRQKFQGKPLTSYRLAKRSGVMASQLQRIELGERDCRVGTLMKIVEGLKMTMAQFWNARV